MIIIKSYNNLNRVIPSKSCTEFIHHLVQGQSYD
jgi:hypothetical protein